MAQAPFDSLTPHQQRQLAQGEPFDSLTPDTMSIKREIEKTRVEMSETIGEIQDRLRPDHLLQQAKDGVRDAATGKVRHIMHSATETAQAAAARVRGAGDHLAWYAREHPIRIAITAGVITWCMLRSRSSSERWYGASDTAWDADEYESMEPSLRDRARDIASTARETVNEYTSTARQAVGSAASTARETVGGYAARTRETVNDYAASAATTARSASRRVQSAASGATSTVDDFVHENPLAAGAVAVAVGAAIGLAIPATEYEDRAMGETRDQAWARAKDVASNLRENVTSRVATAAENVVGESLITNPAASAPSMERA